MREVEREAEAARRGIQHAQGLRHRLLADAVAGDHGDLVGSWHVHFLPRDRGACRCKPMDASGGAG
jgi:hypothetical protein